MVATHELTVCVRVALEKTEIKRCRSLAKGMTYAYQALHKLHPFWVLIPRQLLFQSRNLMLYRKNLFIER